MFKVVWVSKVPRLLHNSLVFGIRNPVVRFNITWGKNEIKFLIYNGSINTRECRRSPFSYFFALLFLCKEERLLFSPQCLWQKPQEEENSQSLWHLPVHPQILFSHQVPFYLTLFHVSSQHLRHIRSLTFNQVLVEIDYTWSAWGRQQTWITLKSNGLLFLIRTLLWKMVGVEL
jgi:hypothetical protein